MQRAAAPGEKKMHLYARRSRAECSPVKGLFPPRLARMGFDVNRRNAARDIKCT